MFRRALDARPAPLLTPFASECVYHYTTAKGFSGILHDEGIRATNFSFLNDLSEVEFGQKLITDRLHERYRSGTFATKGFISAVMDQLDIEAVAEVYVSCFTGLCDDLSQWRAYGSSSAERYAIGFNARRLAWLAEKDGNAEYTRVLYERREQEEAVRFIMDTAVRLFEAEPSTSGARGKYAAITSRYLSRLLPILKDSAYKAEDERRLIVWRNRDGHEPQFDVSRDVLRPYVLLKFSRPVPIMDLHVLAPNRTERARKAAAMRLEAAGIRDVRARVSRIPFAD